MELNKWYFRDNEDGNLTLFFPIKKDKYYYYGTMIEDGDIDFDSGFEPCYFEQNFNKVEYLDIKGNRYSIFDKSYHYLGEVNL